MCMSSGGTKGSSAHVYAACCTCILRRVSVYNESFQLIGSFPFSHPSLVKETPILAFH